MGSLATCCRTCSCPKQADTAVGRRNLLNEKGYYMEEHESFLESSSVKITTEYVEKPDGLLLFTKLIEPKNESSVRGMICYSIGFGDHSEWFNHDVGVHYAELGFVVFCCDWKGHGRSDGIFANIHDFEKEIVDEGIWIFNYAINKYIKSNKVYVDNIDKSNNYFLAGLSMGGAITIQIALKLQNDKNNKFKGIILVAPMVKIAEKAKPPGWQIWCLSNCCLPCCPNAKLIPNPVESSLTTDEELQKKHDDNPVIYYDPMALCTGWNLLNATMDIEKNQHKLKLPMFIGHGDADVLTDCNSSKLFYDNCGCNNTDKAIKIYPGKGHLLFEEEPSVFNDSVEWMLKQIENNKNDNYNDDVNEEKEEKEENQEEEEEQQQLKNSYED